MAYNPIVRNGTGIDTIEIGNSGALVSGNDSLAIGSDATAIGNQSVAIGVNADGTGSTVVAIGKSSSTTADQSIAIGNSATAVGDGSLAIGGNTATAGTYGLSLGFGAKTNDNCISIGYAGGANYGTGERRIFISPDSNSPSEIYGVGTILIGSDSTDYDEGISDNMIIIGNSASNYTRTGRMFGNQSLGGGLASISIGYFSEIGLGADGAIAIGEAASIYQAVFSGIALGSFAGLGEYTEYSIAIGASAEVSGAPTSLFSAESAIAIGHQAFVGKDNDGSIAIGAAATLASGCVSGVVIGAGANAGAGAINSIVIGKNASVLSVAGIVVGIDSSIAATVTNGLVLGRNNILDAASDSGILIGGGLNTTTNNSVEPLWIGNGIWAYTSDDDYSVAVGNWCGVGEKSTSIGYSAAANNDSISLGYANSADDEKMIVIGSSPIGKTHEGVGKIAIGYGVGESNNNNSTSGVSIGIVSETHGPGSVAVGGGARAGWDIGGQGQYSTAIGFEAFCNGSENVAIGANTVAGGGVRNVAIGVNSVAGTVAITQIYSNSIAIGYNAQAFQTDDSIAIGSNVSALGISSIAIGTNATASGSASIAIGTYANDQGISDVAAIGEQDFGGTYPMFVATAKGMALSIIAGESIAAKDIVGTVAFSSNPSANDLRVMKADTDSNDTTFGLMVAMNTVSSGGSCMCLMNGVAEVTMIEKSYSHGDMIIPTNTSGTGNNSSTAAGVNALGTIWGDYSSTSTVWCKIGGMHGE